jgi:hypothetical protein
MTYQQIRGLFFDYWWIAALVLVLIAIAAYGFCGGSGPSRKEQQLESNIDQQKGVNAVITNQIKEQTNVVNGKAENTNQAVNDLRDSVNRPSNQFDGNRANDRFCRDFPDDPSCRK